MACCAVGPQREPTGFVPQAPAGSRCGPTASCHIRNLRVPLHRSRAPTVC